MTTQIQALPIDVIHLIAAGEVIDSLAAVVRELAENALDAGATRIRVALWTDCWRIRVTDNGHGMTEVDLAQAALPHSTSKIQSAADLGQIHSLGFRGEALHSVAQLAKLEICSRSTLSDSGYQGQYDSQGQLAQLQPIAMAPGTIVTADQIFANWPARRQSLPALTQQLRSVNQVIQHLALCHPQVTWQVEQNDRPWFAIYGGNSARPILTQLIKEVSPSDLEELTLPLPSAKLQLLLGLPDRCHRYRPDWLKVAVNHRLVRFPELEQTILASLRRTLPRDRYPVCFLHLQVDPTQVDWNRHPAKAELYLRDLDYWQTQLKQAIDQTLQKSVMPQIDTAHAARLSQVVKAAEEKGVYRTSRSIDPQSEITSTSEDADCPILPLKALTQVHAMYILAEHPSGMWLIEQHIAHERVLYEQLQNRWQIVPLATPLILGQLTEAQVEQLERIGIAVEPFGDQRWAVRSAPEPLVERSDCVDALLELSQGGDLEFALVSTACRTAIRNGTDLTLLEMQTLLDQWLHTSNPRTCPHGRPIYLSLEESSLSRFFRRHWVIGKSHGI